MERGIERSRGRRRRWVGAGLALALIAVAVPPLVGGSWPLGVDQPGPRHVPLTSAPIDAAASCVQDSVSIDQSPSARLALLAEVIDAIRRGVCPVDDEVHRWCRSLFLVAATDPLAALGLGFDDDEVVALVAHHRWALSEAAVAARAAEDLEGEEAMSAMAGIDIGAAIEAGPAAVARAATERAAPWIVEGIESAERVCVSQRR